MKMLEFVRLGYHGNVLAKRLRASNSSSGVSDKQSVGSGPVGRDTCLLKLDTQRNTLPWIR